MLHKSSCRVAPLVGLGVLSHGWMGESRGQRLVSDDGGWELGLDEGGDDGGGGGIGHGLVFDFDVGGGVVGKLAPGTVFALGLFVDTRMLFFERVPGVDGVGSSNDDHTGGAGPSTGQDLCHDEGLHGSRLAGLVLFGNAFCATSSTPSRRWGWVLVRLPWRCVMVEVRAPMIGGGKFPMRRSTRQRGKV